MRRAFDLRGDPLQPEAAVLQVAAPPASATEAGRPWGPLRFLSLPGYFRSLQRHAAPQDEPAPKKKKGGWLANLVRGRD